MRIPLKKINRALKKRFGGRVQAVVERGVLVLRGSAEDWDGVVAAGRLAASPKSRWYTVNEVTWPGAAQRQPKPVPQTDESLAGRAPDVLLIGAGVAYSVLAPTVDDKQIEVTGTDAVQETEVDATADADVSDDTGDGNGANAATTPAPDFTMTDADGATLTLADFKGKPVLLNFWVSWCGPCASEMPDIQSAWEEHGNDVEFVIVNMTDMNGETEQSAKVFLAENNYTFPCYFDANNSAATAFGVSSIPQTYLINAEGNIIGAYMGAMDASVIAQGIDMLAGDTAAPAAQ